MNTLFDILTEAQNGKALDELSRQFRLNQDQMQAAMDAILPAFSEGMKRNAQDPTGMMRNLQAMMQSQGGRYFDDLQAAMQPSGISDGNQILGQLFGSKDVSRALARHAEATTGLGQELIKQLLPVIASMLMGGFLKQSTGQTARSGSSGNIFADMLGQMMQGAQPQTSRAPANPFQDMLEGLMKGGQAPAGDMAENPFGKMFEQMMGGMQQAQRPTEPAPEPKRPASNPYSDMLEQMFDSGRRVQDDYRKGVETIFDQYLDSMDRRR